MNVERLDVTAYTVPTDAPEADGTLAWDTTTVIVVEARSGTTTGLGWTYAAADTGSVVRDLLTRPVLGRSALDVQGTYEAMSRTVRNAGRPGLVACALSAVDIALWDLKARLLELPAAASDRRGARRGAGLRVGRVHHVPRHPSGDPAERLGARPGHRTGQDQDR
ncbi:L-rhamnonate dehydratase [Streptomyces rimosus subsp. rimosus]